MVTEKAKLAVKLKQSRFRRNDKTVDKKFAWERTIIVQMACGHPLRGVSNGLRIREQHVLKDLIAVQPIPVAQAVMG